MGNFEFKCRVEGRTLILEQGERNLQVNLDELKDYECKYNHYSQLALNFIMPSKFDRKTTILPFLVKCDDATQLYVNIAKITQLIESNAPNLQTTLNNQEGSCPQN